MKHIKFSREMVTSHLSRPYISIFLLLCFLLPFQTRIVFFTGESQIFGVYSFYNTLFFYLNDFLISITLIFWLYAIFKDKFHIEQNRKLVHIYLLLIIFWSILVISDVVSYETINIVNFFGLIKLLTVFLLFCFITNVVNVRNFIIKIFWLILASSTIQGVIVIFQYFQQKSLGLKFLGEEYIRVHLPGVASFKILFGYRWIIDQIMHVSREALIVRPYGTFSHPNVMGAFMAFSALLSVYLLSVTRETWKKALIRCALAVQIFGMVISFSRVAILSFMIGVAIYLAVLWYFKREKAGAFIEDGFQVGPVFLYVSGILLCCFILFYPQFLERTGVVSYGTSNQEAVEDREIYQNIAFNMIRQRPLLGVGYQNFARVMDEYSVSPLKDYQHQPVHNIYLLVAAESGLVGLACFLGFIILILKNAFKKIRDPLILLLLSIFFAFLFIGLFDHYLFTIEQGRLMFFLVAGLLFAMVNKKDVSAIGRGG